VPLVYLFYRTFSVLLTAKAPSASLIPLLWVGSNFFSTDPYASSPYLSVPQGQTAGQSGNVALVAVAFSISHTKCLKKGPFGEICMECRRDFLIPVWCTEDYHLVYFQ
jgi:hypothetical protein